MNILLIEAPWPSYLADGSQRSLPPLGIGYLVSALEHTLLFSRPIQNGPILNSLLLLEVTR